MPTAEPVQFVVGLDHVQLAMPAGSEGRARDFYGKVLGMSEAAKPAALAARGGVWFRCGAQMLHLGVETGFRPQRKAHPALLVRDLAAARQRLLDAGHAVVDDALLPGYQRFYTADPFGNRLELLWPMAIGSADAPVAAGHTASADSEPTAGVGDGMGRAEERVKDRVRATFGQSADDYVVSVGHASGADLERLVVLAAPRPTDEVMDLSTGGGHVALALAPHSGQVTAVDLTPAMLRAARQFISARGVRNVRYVVGDAEALPLLDETFDLVSVRIAPHHYARPQRALHEIHRVLVPGGRLVFIDNIAPEQDALDQLLNAWERWRDPSHVRAYRVSEWQRMLAAAGLRVTAAQVGRKRHPFDDWARRTRVADDSRQALEAAMLRAPSEARDYFAIEARGGHVISWSAEYVMLRAERPA